MDVKAPAELSEGKILELFKRLVEASDKSPEFKRVAKAVIAEMRFARARQSA